MTRCLALFAVSALVMACGPRHQTFDAGPDDSGVDAGVDAGRVRGDDPPTGWTVAIPVPADAGTLTHFGVSVSSVGDQFGQPLIAGLIDDPNGDGDRSDTRLIFTRWDGTAKAFSPSQLIEVVGAIDVSAPTRQVSIARDDVTGRIGIAYVKSDQSIRLAFSDDEGANFSLVTVTSTAAPYSNPSLALHDGVTHLAYLKGTVLTYATGASSLVEHPVEGTMLGLAGQPVSLALDSAYQPGIAAFQVRGPGAAAAVAFWRPGSMPTAIADSNGLDVSPSLLRPSVALTFAGTTPHVAYHLRRTPETNTDSDPELFYAVATDGTGTSWKTPVAIPRNDTGLGAVHSTRWYEAITVDATGNIAIGANFYLHGGVTLCGGPKLARSSDGLTFQTCAPNPTPVQFAGEWLTMWHHQPGKLTMVFAYDLPNGSRSNPLIKPGFVMWREP
jgi:hypothetical protein